MDLEPPSKSPLHGEESYGEVEARLAEEIHTAQDEGVSPEELAMQRRRNQAILDLEFVFEHPSSPARPVGRTSIGGRIKTSNALLFLLIRSFAQPARYGGAAIGPWRRLRCGVEDLAGALARLDVQVAVRRLIERERLVHRHLVRRNTAFFSDGARQRALDGRAPTLRRPSAIHLKTSLERQMSSSRVTV